MGVERTVDMSTKKQRKEVQAALGGWLFDGIGSAWSVGQILEQVAVDWHKYVGIPKTVRDMKELSEWQSCVLRLVGLQTSWEAVAEQRVRSANIVLSAHSGGGEDSVLSLLGVEIAKDILADTFTGRSELLKQGKDLLDVLS
jgi:hypothetical protein